MDEFRRRVSRKSALTPALSPRRGRRARRRTSWRRRGRGGGGRIGSKESALTLHPPQYCYGGRAALSPRRGRRARPLCKLGSGFAAEGVEEGVSAVVGGPDGEAEVPGDSARGRIPESLGVGMEGEFEEAHVGAVGAKGVRVGAEGKHS